MTKKDRQVAGATLAGNNIAEPNNPDRAMRARDLKNLYYLKKEIKEQQRRIAELEAAATKCTANISGMPSGKGVSDKVGQYAAQVVDLKALLDLNIKKSFYEFNRLIRYIGSVEDPVIRQIMIYRFENHMSWRQIERAIGGNNKAESLRKRLYRYLKRHI